MTTFTQAFPLEDIRIRSGSDGRTVEAYAAVFNSPAEIHDRDGHYLDRFRRPGSTRPSPMPPRPGRAPAG